MTKDEILNMEPGPELNRLVAIHVMHFEETEHKSLFTDLGKLFATSRYWIPKEPHWMFLPSEDDIVFWLVVEAMRHNSFAFHAKGWINTDDIEIRFTDTKGNIFYAYADNPAEAISKCALIAVLGLN